MWEMIQQFVMVRIGMLISSSYVSVVFWWMVMMILLMYMIGVVISMVVVIWIRNRICWMLLVLWVNNVGVLNWVVLCFEKVMMCLNIVECRLWLKFVLVWEFRQIVLIVYSICNLVILSIIVFSCMMVVVLFLVMLLLMIVVLIVGRYSEVRVLISCSIISIVISWWYGWMCWCSRVRSIG